MIPGFRRFQGMRRHEKERDKKKKKEDGEGSRRTSYLHH
jgi:hypothetical protein